MRSTLAFPVFLRILIPLGLAAGCGPKPVPQDVSFPLGPGENPLALWIATTNYSTGGTLERLDPSTGRIDRSVLSLGSDTVILPDGEQGLFLLTRTANDSVTLLSGPGGSVQHTRALPARSNAQYAARDSQGRVWVVCLESNEVQIFSPELSEKTGGIELGSLREPSSPEGLADLSQVAMIDPGHMAVLAQRLDRSPKGWAPAALSGLAIIDTASLGVTKQLFIPAPNPHAVFGGNGQLFILGSGDLSPAGSTLAASQEFAMDAPLPPPVRFPFRILDADFGPSGESPALIAWYPEKAESCLQVGDRKVLCAGGPEDGGYVFNRIVRMGRLLYVSYVSLGNSELWIVPLDGAPEVKKIPMNLPIGSMARGP